MRPAQREGLWRRKRSWEQASLAELPALPPKAVFRPKFSLPELASYRGMLKPSYWSQWRTKKMTKNSKGKSWVSAVALKDLARRAGNSNSHLMDKVTRRLMEGAEIGVEGRGRLSTIAVNTEAVYNNGLAISDTLQEGIVDGYLAGPYTREELVKLVGPDFSVNPINCREKPNGKLRIIVDASAPHDRDESVPGWIWNPELPGSTNSTIDTKRFPASMSSVNKFVKALHRVGRGARICKIDQTSAYKHQHVRKEDWGLQIIQWGGRYFIELSLMFGTRSSPGIYDELHKAFISSVVKLSPDMPKNQVEQHLDDVLAIGFPEKDNTRSVDAFFRTYLEEAKKVGFKVDQSGDKNKVQPPEHTVVALGVVFDSVAWTWGFKPEKLARILHTLATIRGEEEVEFGTIQSITGKLVDIRLLVPGGKFNLLFFLKAAQSEVGKNVKVQISAELREQATWWTTALMSAKDGSPIVNPDRGAPSTAVEGFCDAAGGSSSYTGAGVGGLIPPFRYFYLPWPRWLNMGGTNSVGVMFASKLSCLELLGALITLTIGVDLAAGGHLRVFVDNQGAVDIFRKGHSSKCAYTTTVAKAIFEVAQATGVKVSVEKIRRCSTRGAYTADKISKGNMAELRRMMPMRENPCTIPNSIISWVKDPRVDMHWSGKILDDLQKRGVEVIIPY